jgi:hypothetical protein
LTASDVKLPAADEIAQPQFRPGRILTRRGRPALVAAVFLACGAVLFYLYLGQAKTMPVASDGASQALQAWAMLHGNLLLHGWSLSDVSFYSTELPQFMLIEAVRGLNGQVVHVAAAMTYTLLVIGVAVLAKGNATGRLGLMRALIASGILLAPPLGVRSTTWVVLNYPDHTGTQVSLLLIWLVLDRVKPRWWVPLVIAVLLTWVQVADTMALYEGVLPIVAVSAIRVIRRGRKRVRPRLAEHWYELSLAVSALVSAYAATRILLLIRQAGGFDFSPPSTSFATIGGMSSNVWPKVQTELILFGANFFGLPLKAALVPLLHLVGVALVIWAVAVAARRFIAEDEFMTQLLTVTFIAVFAAYSFGFRVGAWEVIGLLPIGAVLAGRLLPERLTKAGLVMPLAAVLACYGLLLFEDSRVPAPGSDNVTIANWLTAHHLRYGLARYWHANSVTLDSGGQVQVRAIDTQANEFLLTHWNTDSSWYNPRLHNATFIILPADAWASLRSVYGAVGKPVSTYHLGLYVVMVWHKNLLTGPFVSGRFVGWDILAAKSARSRAWAHPVADAAYG